MFSLEKNVCTYHMLERLPSRNWRKIVHLLHMAGQEALGLNYSKEGLD